MNETPEKSTDSVYNSGAIIKTYRNKQELYYKGNVFIYTGRVRLKYHASNDHVYNMQVNGDYGMKVIREI